MRRQQSILLLLVLLPNAAILTGTIIFGWSPAAVALLFAIDALLTILRIPMEKLVATRPPNKADLHAREFLLWEWNLVDKRGCYRLPLVPVTIYPQNLAYVLRYLLSLCVFATLAFAMYYLGASATRPDAWGIDPTLAVVIPLLLAKHGAIVAVWATNNVYEHASVNTVRPREALYATLVGLFAVGSILVMPPEIMTTIVAIVLIPKLLFDFREAGIGPSVVTFDPSCERNAEEIPTPAGSPQAVFRTDQRSVMSGAIVVLTPPFVLAYGLFVFGLIAGVTHTVVGLENTTWGWMGVIAATITILYGVGLIVAQIAYGDCEYRLYDNTLVAYDTRLRTVQWQIPLEEITSVSVTQSISSLLTPFCGPTVCIEYHDDDPPVDNRAYYTPLERLPYLKDPDKMATAIDQALPRQR